MTTNASFIYYRDKSFGKDLDKKKIKEILGLKTNCLNATTTICNISYLEYFKIPDAVSFKLKTTYPGLIIGAGYNHPAGKMGEDESSDFQLGFYFDHTTGMPVIPGSTVKGILKAVFPKQNDDKEIRNEKLNYINNELTEKTLNNGLKLVDSKDHKNDWRKLFEKGNIFFDAFISAIPSNGRIFAEDYITPHHSKGIFKNPNPIRFLKIAPDVTFTFQFKLKESCFENDKKITPKEKLELFKKIIVDFGIGAKRNVGYGNLTDFV